VAPWTAYGGAQNNVAAVPRTGSLSLRMTVTAANTGVYQDVTWLVPGMFYQFNAWVRSESGWTMAALTASNPDGSNLTSWGTQSIYTNWQTLSVGFRPNSQGTVRIRLVKMDTADALYWDDVEISQYQGSCTKGTRLRYYPYGQEIGTVTANDTAKFGTYTQDSGSGLDYAMNRYYMSIWGRFTTADPYRASGGAESPASWNRYSYVQGDPANYFDPPGLFSQDACYGQLGCQYQASSDNMHGLEDYYGDRGFLGYGDDGPEYSALPQGLIQGNEVSEEVTPPAKPESHDECVKRITAEQRAKLVVRGREIHHAICTFSKATAIVGGVIGVVVGGFSAGPAGAVAFGSAGAVVGFITPYPYGDIWTVGATIGNIRETKKRIESECP